MHSSQPYQEATATADGYSRTYRTDGSCVLPQAEGLRVAGVWTAAVVPRPEPPAERMAAMVDK
ncbi:MAG: hypothetical protein ACRDOL_43345 [Streptosporangiaceae bacterium]